MKNFNLRILSVLAAASLVALVGASHLGFADEQIIHQYESVRDQGMGGLKLTTGLYDDNFFGNPARATANPTWRFTLLDPSVQVDNHMISHVNSFTSGSDKVQALANTAGENNHARVQTTMPAWYLPPSDSRRWTLNVAVITSSQFDLSIRQNYSVSDDAYIDVGPAVTYAYEFLSDRTWSVGVTGHVTYRLATNQPYTIANLLQGQSFAISSIGKQGTSVDFDLGTTKIIHWHPAGIEISTAFAVNNVMGGRYNTQFVKPISGITQKPDPANRSYGLGIAAKRDLPFIKDFLIGVESYDLGNNPGGSFYRTLHVGAEARIGHVLRPRIGINQGYLAAGLGIDLRYVEIEAATWGEELSLNAGGNQDRIYGAKVAFQL